MIKHPDIVKGWVYSLHDYRQMFDLSDQDLDRKILDYPGGISSFNAQMQQQGHSVMSGDPAYDLSLDQMQAHADYLLQKNEAHLKEHLDKLQLADEAVVSTIFSAWEESERTFLADYEVGKAEQRYLKMAMPRLPFDDFTFDLALCSDLLFHSQLNNKATPQQFVGELCRVAHELRVFPLLNERGDIADALGHIMMTLQQNNFGVEVREVPYEQLKGGNAMLRIWAKECVV